VRRGFPEEVLAEIKERADIVEVVSEHVGLRKSGRNYVGLCPFHQEKTPSFTVSPDRQMFYCFGCHVGGDVFNFVMKAEGLEFPDAVRQLAERTGVDAELRDDPAERRRRAARQRIAAALDAAARWFQRLLRSREAAAARVYLGSRGYSEETIQRFGLGYSMPQWDALLRRMKQEGYPEKVLEAAGLVQRRRDGSGWYDRFRGRLMFPIRDGRGRVIGFGGRALSDGDEPKYLNSPETATFNKRRVWYGLDLARDAIRRLDSAVVVEGYTDLITLHRAGVTNAVASLGTALSEQQALSLSRLAGSIVIAYDADAAGTDAALRGLERFEPSGARVAVATLPEGYDPDSFVRERGREAFDELLVEAKPLLGFRFWLACSRGDPSTTEGKLEILREVLPAVARVESPVERETYLSQWEVELGIQPGLLREELRRYTRPARRGRRRDFPDREQDPGYTNIDSRDGPVRERAAPAGSKDADRLAEREVLLFALSDSDALGEIARRLSPDDFEDPAHRAVAAALFEQAAGGEDTLGVLDDDARRVVARLSVETPSYTRREKALSDLIGRIENRSRRRRLARVEKEIVSRLDAGKGVPDDMMNEYKELLMALKGA